MLHSFIVQTDVIGDAGYVLAVRRSRSSGSYGISKILLECLHISSCPGHLNGIPDRSLHFLICGFKMLCDSGIQQLGNAAYHLHVFS